MSSFLTPIQDHQVFEGLAKVAEELRSVDRGSLDGEAAPILERTNKLVDRIREILKNADKSLLSVKVLNKTHSLVSRLQDEFAKCKESGRWEPLLERGDALFANLTTLPTPDYLRILNEDARSRWEKMQSEYEEFLRSKEVQWNESISRRDATISEKLNEWESQFSSAENKRQERFTQERNERSTHFSTWQNESKTAVIDLTAEWEASLEAQKKEQLAEFETLHKEQSVAFEEQLKKQTQDAKDLFSKVTEDADAVRASNASIAAEHLTELKRLEVEARNLVGLIGNTAVTGNYQKIANQEQITANKFRVGALLSLAILGALAIWIAYGINAADFNWEVAIFRLLAGIPFLGAAIYCGRESSRHRTNEERNRRLELELTALEPYLYQLSEDKAAMVRETLTTKYFGNGSREDPSSDGRPVEDVIRDTLKPLEPIADFAKRFLK